MKYISAYLLCVIGGNHNPTKDQVAEILKVAGAECDNAKLDALFKEVEGKDAFELIAAGKEKMATLGAAAPVAAGAAPAAAAAAPAEEEKKEEKKEEEEEEEDGDFGLDLFG